MQLESTLTGFKFIGHRIEELSKTDTTFLFGYEESYGYLVQDFVRDKDAFQAIVLACEAVSYFKHFDKTLVDVLEDIYNKYGYYQETLVNIVLEGKEGQERITSVMEHLRTSPFTTVLDQPVNIIEDYLTSERKSKDGIEPITLPQSNVLKYILQDGSWFVLRPSGTEPKLKLYVSAIDTSIEASEKKCESIKDFVLNQLTPLLNG